MPTLLYPVWGIVCSGNIDETSNFSENFSHTSMQIAANVTEKTVLFLLWSSRCIYAIKAPWANNAPYVQMISAVLEGDGITHCGAPSLRRSCEHVNSQQLWQRWVCPHMHRRSIEKDDYAINYAKNFFYYKCVGPTITIIIIYMDDGRTPYTTSINYHLS